MLLLSGVGEDNIEDEVEEGQTEEVDDEFHVEDKENIFNASFS